DVRHVLPAIRVPTLIIHRTGDQATPVEGARYMAKHISGAKYVELPGVDHFAWTGDTDTSLEGAEEFVTGDRPHHQLGLGLGRALGRARLEHREGPRRRCGPALRRPRHAHPPRRARGVAPLRGRGVNARMDI